MLWAITHQLESFSNVGSDVMSTNLNLVSQTRTLCCSTNHEEMEFMRCDYEVPGMFFIAAYSGGLPSKYSP